MRPNKVLGACIHSVSFTELQCFFIMKLQVLMSNEPFHKSLDLFILDKINKSPDWSVVCKKTFKSKFSPNAVKHILPFSVLILPLMKAYIANEIDIDSSYGYF